MPLSQENQIQMAIAAYKNQKVRSILKTTEIFGVPEATLYACLKERQPHAETCANGYRLKAIEEETLIQQLLETDKQGFSIQSEFLCSMAQILLCECLQNSTAVLSINWAYKFVKCHPELCTRYN